MKEWFVGSKENTYITDTSSTVEGSWLDDDCHSFSPDSRMRFQQAKEGLVSIMAILTAGMRQASFMLMRSNFPEVCSSVGQGTSAPDA